MSLYIFYVLLTVHDKNPLYGIYIICTYIHKSIGGPWVLVQTYVSENALVSACAAITIIITFGTLKSAQTCILLVHNH